jgi:Na+-driven multidrug efflux pump
LSKDICKYAVIIALVLDAGCLLFYEEIGLIFNNDAAVMALFTQVFWLVLAMQPINAIAFMFDGIFKGLGEASLLRNILLAATFLGFTPALLIADYFGLQLYAIWIGFLVWMLVRSVPLVIYFRKNYLKQ